MLSSILKPLASTAQFSNRLIICQSLIRPVPTILFRAFPQAYRGGRCGASRNWRGNSPTSTAGLYCAFGDWTSQMPRTTASLLQAWENALSKERLNNNALSKEHVLSSHLKKLWKHMLFSQDNDPKRFPCHEFISKTRANMKIWNGYPQKYHLAAWRIPANTDVLSSLNWNARPINAIPFWACLENSCRSFCKISVRSIAYFPHAVHSTSFPAFHEWQPNTPTTGILT